MYTKIRGVNAFKLIVSNETGKGWPKVHKEVLMVYECSLVTIGALQGFTLQQIKNKVENELVNITLAGWKVSLG